MSTQTIAHPDSSPSRLRAGVRRGWSISPLLTLTVLLSIIAVPVIIIAALVDPVQITGVNGWIKPLKFFISVALYCATILWMLTFVRSGRRWVGIVAGLVGAILLAEIALIVVQVLRGTTSHFNDATPFDAAVFAAMGAMISTLALLNLIVGIWLLRARIDEPVLAAGLRWGIWIALAGMLLAFLMTMPTQAQQVAMNAGETVTIVGAHSVGVADGGPGLPLVGWSTVGGDLRIPHFVGLHAMQLLPLLAWALLQPGAARRWSRHQRVRLVHIAGMGYALLVALLTWQALRGQPLLAPDLLTAGALLVWAGIMAGGVALVLRSAAHVPATQAGD